MYACAMQLVFHAGRLASLQASFTHSANALARSFPHSAPYHSPVLLNALARIAASPSYALTPAALTAPLPSTPALTSAPRRSTGATSSGTTCASSSSP